MAYQFFICRNLMSHVLFDLDEQLFFFGQSFWVEIGFGAFITRRFAENSQRFTETYFKIKAHHYKNFLHLQRF